EDLELKEGLQLQAQTQQGPIPVVVKEIKPETVVVDFNHPLAGQELTFDYEVVEKRPATEEDLNQLLNAQK
ncbi:MAG: FKBP-type peptidyl-prolyl cis-trans isomerase, partial [Bacteroidota bacterium]